MVKKKESNIISIGAEAVLIKEKGIIIKKRIPKLYRISELDNKLRKQRTRKEAKVLANLPIPGPKFIGFDDREMTIQMEFLEGYKLSDVFENMDYLLVSKEIAKMIKKLHDHDIIHGDLTTSNMIISEITPKKIINETKLSVLINESKPNIKGNKTKSNLIINDTKSNLITNDKLYFIDFGLSFTSNKIEDKAVDLHLLYQALQSKHYTIADECFKIICKVYNDKEVINRLNKVELRGRNKIKNK